MFTYYQAENSTAEPALVNAIEQGLRAEHGVVTEDDILMELTKWVEASDNDILSDIYQQTINYVVSGQWSVVSGQWSAPYALRCYA
ncbi:biofilm-dependent modulation protein [Escherichia coli]